MVSTLFPGNLMSLFIGPPQKIGVPPDDLVPRVRELAALHLSQRKIALLTGYSQTNISKFMFRHKIAPGRRIGDDLKDQVIGMWIAGKNTHQIGEELGFAHVTVSSALHRWGIDPKKT